MSRVASHLCRFSCWLRGVCVRVGELYQCICFDGYTGEYCSISDSPGTSTPPTIPSTAPIPASSSSLPVPCPSGGVSGEFLSDFPFNLLDDVTFRRLDLLFGVLHGPHSASARFLVLLLPPSSSQQG
ncbi:unnamed protein product [Caenorhabditis nigoni]